MPLNERMLLCQKNLLIKIQNKKRPIFLLVFQIQLQTLSFLYSKQKLAKQVTYTMQTNDTTENNKPISDINIQHMTGEDKNIEIYEQVVSNIFSYQSKSKNEVKEIGGNTITNTPTIQPISITHQKPIIQKEAIGHAPRTE